MPQSYLASLITPGPGYEALQAFAKLMERTSLAVDRCDLGGHILTALGGARATVLVEFYRDTALQPPLIDPAVTTSATATVLTDTTKSFGTNLWIGQMLTYTSGPASGQSRTITSNAATTVTVGVAFAPAPTPGGGDGYLIVSPSVTVKAGTIVTTSQGGRDFVTTADAVFGSSTLVVTNVPATAVVSGYEFNVPGPVTTADRTVLPGDIDTVEFFYQNPVFGDQSIQVRQVTSATGGVDADLDQLGADRGIARQVGESDAQYRARVRSLPDTISPDAIQRSIAAVLVPFGSPAFDFEETWDPHYQTSWDMPSNNVGTPTFDLAHYDAVFSNIFTYDDSRASPPFIDRWLDDVEARGAFIVVTPDLGGLDVPAYAAMYDMLQAIKAAGVAAILELAGQ